MSANVTLSSPSNVPNVLYIFTPNLVKGALILLCQMISVECSTNFEFGATFSIEV